MHVTERVCEVSPYSDAYAPRKDVQVGCAATGYTDSHGRDYILILNEALWMPDLDATLINPNQLRHNGIEVQDNPYSDSPMTLRSADDGVTFGLKSQGTTIYLDTWSPTNEDLQTNPHIILSSDVAWDPQHVCFPGSDPSTIYDMEHNNERRQLASLFQTAIEAYPETDDASLPLQNSLFHIQDMRRQICVMNSLIHPSEHANLTGPLREDELKAPHTFLSSQRHSNTTAEDLSEAWQISLKQAAMTLEATMQHHVRSATMPLSRRYRTDRMFQTKRIRCSMALDTTYEGYSWQ